MGDFHRTPTHPTARKVYRCIGCFAAIQAGEKHTATSGVYDGSFYAHRFHDECLKAIRDEQERYGDDEFMPGQCEPPARLAKQPKEPSNG